MDHLTFPLEVVRLRSDSLRRRLTRTVSATSSGIFPFVHHIWGGGVWREHRGAWNWVCVKRETSLRDLQGLVTLDGERRLLFSIPCASNLSQPIITLCFYTASGCTTITSENSVMQMHICLVAVRVSGRWWRARQSQHQLILIPESCVSFIFSNNRTMTKVWD